MVAEGSVPTFSQELSEQCAVSVKYVQNLRRGCKRIGSSEAWRVFRTGGCIWKYFGDMPHVDLVLIQSGQDNLWAGRLKIEQLILRLYLTH